MEMLQRERSSGDKLMKHELMVSEYIDGEWRVIKLDRGCIVWDVCFDNENQMLKFVKMLLGED